MNLEVEMKAVGRNVTNMSSLCKLAWLIKKIFPPQLFSSSLILHDILALFFVGVYQWWRSRNAKI